MELFIITLFITLWLTAISISEMQNKTKLSSYRPQLEQLHRKLKFLTAFIARQVQIDNGDVVTAFCDFDNYTINWPNIPSKFYVSVPPSMGINYKENPIHIQIGVVFTIGNSSHYKIVKITNKLDGVYLDIERVEVCVKETQEKVNLKTKNNGNPIKN